MLYPPKRSKDMKLTLSDPNESHLIRQMEGVNLEDQQAIQSNVCSLVLQEVNVVKENAGEHELPVRSGETAWINESDTEYNYPLWLLTSSSGGFFTKVVNSKLRMSYLGFW